MFGHRGQEFPAVGVMAVGRRVADSGQSLHVAHHDGVRATCAGQVDGMVEKDLTQVSVVIGIGASGGQRDSFPQLMLTTLTSATERSQPPYRPTFSARSSRMRSDASRGLVGSNKPTWSNPTSSAARQYSGSGGAAKIVNGTS